MLTCQGNVGPAADLCDGLDNDCDDFTDESSAALSMACSQTLAAAIHVAGWGCTASQCSIGSCSAGWADANGSASDGCEHPPEGATCANPTPVVAPGITEMGVTVFPNTDSGGSAPCQATGQERVYLVAAAEGQSVTVTVTPHGFDAVLYTRATCPAAGDPLQCEDNSNPMGQEVLVYTQPGPANTTYVVVDSWETAPGGTFDIQISITL